MGPVPHLEETLRKLTVRDDRYVAAVLGDGEENAAASGLDARTYALVRVAALVALDASAASYQRVVCDAYAAGATADEIAAHARAHLSGPKVPREIAVLDELPKNPTGKVLKRELRGL